MGWIPTGGGGGGGTLDRVSSQDGDASGDSVITVATGARGEASTVTVTVAAGELVFISASCEIRRASTSSFAGTARIERKTGTDIRSWNYHSHGVVALVTVGGAFIDEPGAGSHTYALDVLNDAGSAGTVTVSKVELLAQVIGIA